MEKHERKDGEGSVARRTGSQMQEKEVAGRCRIRTQEGGGKERA